MQGCLHSPHSVSNPVTLPCPRAHTLHFQSHKHGPDSGQKESALFSIQLHSPTNLALLEFQGCWRGNTMHGEKRSLGCSSFDFESKICNLLYDRLLVNYLTLQASVSSYLKGEQCGLPFKVVWQLTMNSFIHLKIFIEHLLYATDCVRYWEYWGASQKAHACVEFAV